MSYEMGCGASSPTPSVLPPETGKRSAHSKRRPSEEFRFIEHKTSGSTASHDRDHVGEFREESRSSSRTTGGTNTTSATAKSSSKNSRLATPSPKQRSEPSCQPGPSRVDTSKQGDGSAGKHSAEKSARKPSSRQPQEDANNRLVPEVEQTPVQLIQSTHLSMLEGGEEIASLSEHSFVVIQRKIKAAWDTEPERSAAGKEIMLHKPLVPDSDEALLASGSSAHSAMAQLASRNSASSLHPQTAPATTASQTPDPGASPPNETEQKTPEEQPKVNHTTAEEAAKDTNEARLLTSQESPETSPKRPLRHSEADMTDLSAEAYIPRPTNFIGAVRCHFRHWPGVQWPRKSNSVCPQLPPSPSSSTENQHPLLPESLEGQLSCTNSDRLTLFRPKSRMVRSRTVDLATIASRLKGRVKSESLSPKVPRPMTVPTVGASNKRNPFLHAASSKSRSHSGHKNAGNSSTTTKFLAKMNSWTPLQVSPPPMTASTDSSGNKSARDVSTAEEDLGTDDIYSFEEGAICKDIATVHSDFFNDFEDLLDDDLDGDIFGSLYEKSVQPCIRTLSPVTLKTC